LPEYKPRVPTYSQALLGFSYPDLKVARCGVFSQTNATSPPRSSRLRGRRCIDVILF
jgi:hypothetical protein